MATPGKSLEVSKSSLEALLKKHRGRIKSVAEELGCQRHCVLRHVREYDDLIELMGELRKGYHNTILDMAEDNIITHLEKGNLTATFYVLNTRGRERDWIPRDTSPADEEKKQDLIAFVSGFQAARSLSPAVTTVDHSDSPESEAIDHPSPGISQ